MLSAIYRGMLSYESWVLSTIQLPLQISSLSTWAVFRFSQRVFYPFSSGASGSTVTTVLMLSGRSDPSERGWHPFMAKAFASYRPLPNLGMPTSANISFSDLVIYPYLQYISKATAQDVSEVNLFGPAVITSFKPFGSEAVVSFAPFFDRRPNVGEIY